MTRHFLTTLDWSVEEVRDLVDRALRIKRGTDRPSLAGRILGLMFFNPSVRTRVSCESAIARLGGAAIAVSPGSETWSFEHEDGAVMDGATQEHVRELAPVLSRYCHAIGIRKSELITTAATTARVTASWPELRRDAFLRKFAERATVPVINLESNAFHPCQGLADMATMVEKLGDPRGKKYVLTWAWHPKSLPVATPHSQLLAACDLGMDVTLLRPPRYELDPEVTAAAKRRAEEAGGSLRETDDVETAYRGARIVTAKSWGSLAYYGRFDQEARDKQGLRAGWIVDEAKLAKTADAWFMHCLPVRRNVVVTDGVLDGPRSIVVDEAENRLWTAAAVLCALLG
ncbi:MAG TPA: N-acetylornithine carbamoyltransferase [Planctomycetota bacterium]|nr:N-acetylornithine carbamoyltransferase [Planctomycetota bacterium]